MTSQYLINDISNIDGIKQKITEYGFVIIPDIVSSIEHQNFISDIYQYILNTPRVPEKQIQLSAEDIENSLSKAKVKELRDRWYLHATFGAPCEFHAFQIATANHLRERLDLYQLYSELLGETKLLYYQDRIGIKLPGQGETEFIHIDADPHYRKPDLQSKLQSIIFFSDAKFYCIPGSNKAEFHQSIIDNYPYLTKGSKPRSMTNIDKKRDYLDLGNHVEEISIPKDSLLIFTENLWHASKPNKSDKIRINCYFGYHRFLECPNTIGERLNSYITGRRPPRFPSGGKTYLVPKMYYNFPESPNLMQKYLKLVPEEYHGSHIVKKSGKQVLWLDESKWDPKITHQYQPYPHSELGKKLLGILSW